MEKKHTEMIKPKWVIEGMEDSIILINQFGMDMDARSWGYEEGVLLSGNEARVLIDSHYSLLEALKGLLNDLDGEMLSTGVNLTIAQAEEVLKNCEGK